MKRAGLWLTWSSPGLARRLQRRREVWEPEAESVRFLREEPADAGVHLGLSVSPGKLGALREALESIAGPPAAARVYGVRGPEVSREWRDLAAAWSVAQFSWDESRVRLVIPVCGAGPDWEAALAAVSKRVRSRRPFWSVVELRPGREAEEGRPVAVVEIEDPRLVPPDEVVAVLRCWASERELAIGRPRLVGFVREGLLEGLEHVALDPAQVWREE